MDMPVQGTPPSSQTPQASSQANSPFTLANVAPPASTPNAAQKSGGKMKWIVVGVILLAFAAGAFYSYQKFTATDVTNVTADVPADVNGDEAVVEATEAVAPATAPAPEASSDAPITETSDHDIVTPNSTPVVEPPLDSTSPVEPSADSTTTTDTTDTVTTPDTTTTTDATTSTDTTTDTTPQKVPRPKN